MEMLSGVAREKGVSDKELGAIQSIVMLVSAGRVFAQYGEVCEGIEAATKAGACCG
ncbi:conserved hypothetical protein [Syntrophobacter sp. SbD1]|nr:conserved hypothetical protein [Syntrophobacter sp. SbD1]